jgi:hypothetical protein
MKTRNVLLLTALPGFALLNQSVQAGDIDVYEIAAPDVGLASAGYSAGTHDTSATELTLNAAAGKIGTPIMEAPLTEPGDNSWHFGVSLPAWFPQINGNITLFGRQQNVDISYATLREHLDAAFGGAFSASKGKLGFYSEASYMKFSADGNVGGANSSAELKFFLNNSGLSYDLVKTGEDHPFVLTAKAGIRYWYASLKLDVSDPRVPAFNRGKTWNLVDPVIGLSASQFLTPKLHLDVGGDFGGFNINHDTDWTWSATGVVTYDFAKWFSLSAGYSALALDESKGSGAGLDGVNLIFHGALVVATFKF